ncbi:hypothetical protein [Diaminobutyricibacter sp. McL0608]|uniref:hypothetical protein n=1 Tax=Leifsonia sp. McL0608 TaxID=3143537 RepID=UPI0031F2E118
MTGSKPRMPIWAIILIVVASLATAPVVAGVAFFVWVFGTSFQPPDVGGAASHVRSMHCVAWARSFSDGGGVDVRKSAIIQVGLKPGCTEGDINETYAYIFQNTIKVRDDADVKVDYLVMPHAPNQKPGTDVYSTTRTTGAQLTMEPVYGLPTASEFAETVSDWMTARSEVDDGAQLELVSSDLWTNQPERIVVNSTSEQLRSLRSTLSPRLRSMAWKVTIPARGDTPYVREGAGPAGGVTLETNFGFPDAGLVELGQKLNGAWPAASSNDEFVYLYRNAPETAGGGFNEVNARIFGVDPSEAFTSGTPSSPESTVAWPALAAFVDAIRKPAHDLGQRVTVGIGLYDRPFADGDDHPQAGSTGLRDDTPIALFDSNYCPTPDQNDSTPDGGVIESSLCRYWVQAGSAPE